MAAEPQRDKREALSPERHSSPATNQLVEALVSRAAASHQRDILNARVERAKEASADRIDYYWQLDDDREAELRVYFVADSEVEIVAVELMQIDTRQPTADERLRFESEFLAHVEEAGALWEDVASYLWEKAR